MIEEIITFDDSESEIVTFDNTDSELVTFEENGIDGTNNYNFLKNKPQINGVELNNNKTSSDLKLQDEMSPLSNMDIIKILGGK